MHECIVSVKMIFIACSIRKMCLWMYGGILLELLAGLIAHQPTECNAAIAGVPAQLPDPRNPNQNSC